MTVFDKYALKEDLKTGVYTIVFEKVDGTIREMRCTLEPEVLPKIVNENSYVGRPENPDLLAVWDIDNDGWRSMRVSSIQTVVKES